MMMGKRVLRRPLRGGVLAQGVISSVFLATFEQPIVTSDGLGDGFIQRGGVCHGEEEILDVLP
jgi:hypothetical protein